MEQWALLPISSVFPRLQTLQHDCCSQRQGPATTADCWVVFKAVPSADKCKRSAQEEKLLHSTCSQKTEGIWRHITKIYWPGLCQLVTPDPKPSKGANQSQGNSPYFLVAEFDPAAVLPGRTQLPPVTSPNHYYRHKLRYFFTGVTQLELPNWAPWDYFLI